MADLADRLGGPPPMGTGDAVVDATGLAGTLDLTLNLDIVNFTGGADMFADFVNGALERQFGLKLEHRKMPLETLLVERGNRIPAGN